MASKTKIILIAAFALITVFVRFYNLEENPLWYTDETNYITLSWQLGQGVPIDKAAHKALIFPFATDAVPHPPTYFQASGLAMRILGKGVLAGRALSAALALLSTVLLYSAVRRLWGHMAGLVAAGLFTLHLPSVLFLRWGMPYNLCMACQIASFCALAMGQRGKRRGILNMAAIILASGASVSVFFGVITLAFVALVAGIRLKRRPVILLVGLLLGAGLFAEFLLLGLLIRGEAFWNDFLALGFRASGAGGMGDRIVALLRQIVRMAFLRDGVYTVGLAGLVWIAVSSRKRRWVPLYFLFAALPVLLKRGNDPAIKYDAVTFLFLLHAGAGAFAAMLCRSVARCIAKRNPGSEIQCRIWSRRMTWGGAIAILIMLAATRICQVATRLPSEYEAVGSVLSAGDARAAADWINDRTSAEDLVISPERIDFLMDCRAASFYQSIAYVAGSTTWHHDIEPWRFAFPCDFRQAKFIVLDHTDRMLVLSPANPNMELAIAELNSVRWRQAAEIGEYWIFERIAK